MKRFITVLLVAAAALLLISCQPFFSVSESEISFDSSGHVKEVAAYTTYSGSYIDVTTFSTDGTYESVETTYDNTSSSWKQDYGYKGTYSFDTKNRTLTLNYTQAWSGGIGGSYVTLTSSSSDLQTTTETVLFGSDNLFMLLMGSNGTYSYSSTRVYWNGTSATGTMTLALATDLSTATQTNELDSYDVSNNVTNASKSSDVMTKNAIYPSGISSLNDAKGKTFTFAWIQDVATPYTWTGSGKNFTQGAATTRNNAGSAMITVASDLSYVATMPGTGLTFERSLIGR